MAGIPYEMKSRGKKNSRSPIVSKPEATKSLHPVLACYWAHLGGFGRYDSEPHCARMDAEIQSREPRLACKGSSLLALLVSEALRPVYKSLLQEPLHAGSAGRNW